MAFRAVTDRSNPAANLDAWLWRRNRRPPRPSPGQQLPTPHGSIRVRRSGPPNGSPTLVLLCDPPNMVEHYDPTLAALDTVTPSVVVELPGFGFSPVNRGRGLEFHATVEAVESALQQLGDGPWVLFGPCICGFVAAEIAQRRQVPVAGLVLAQVPDVSGMQAWCDRMDPQNRLRRPWMGQILGRLGASRLTRFWYRFATAAETDHQPLTQIAERMLDAGAGYPLATMLQCWGDALRDASLQLPALVLWGRNDRSHATTDRHSSLRHVPGARLVELDQCGHFPDLEQPEQFAALVQEFLASLPADEAGRAPPASSKP